AAIWAFAWALCMRPLRCYRKVQLASLRTWFAGEVCRWHARGCGGGCSGGRARASCAVRKVYSAFVAAFASCVRPPPFEEPAPPSATPPRPREAPAAHAHAPGARDAVKERASSAHALGRIPHARSA